MPDRTNYLPLIADALAFESASFEPIQLKAYILEHSDAYPSEISEVFQCATSSVHDTLTKLGLITFRNYHKYFSRKNRLFR